MSQRTGIKSRPGATLARAPLQRGRESDDDGENSDLAARLGAPALLAAPLLCAAASRLCRRLGRCALRMRDAPCGETATCASCAKGHGCLACSCPRLRLALALRRRTLTLRRFFAYRVAERARGEVMQASGAPTQLSQPPTQAAGAQQAVPPAQSSDGDAMEPPSAQHADDGTDSEEEKWVVAMRA